MNTNYLLRKVTSWKRRLRSNSIEFSWRFHRFTIRWNQWRTRRCLTIET